MQSGWTPQNKKEETEKYLAKYFLETKTCNFGETVDHALQERTEDNLATYFFRNNNLKSWLEKTL